MTEQQRTQYEALGYHRVVDVIKPDELNLLRAAFDQAERTGGLDDLPNRDDLFVRLVEHPGFFPIVHCIVGDDVQVRSIGGTTYTPENGRQDWRREVAGLLGVDHPECTLSVRVYVPLDNDDGGGVAIVPGSHRLAEETPFPSIARLEDMPHSAVLPSGPGSVLILNDNIWKARIPGSVPCRLIELTYTHCWMRQALPELSPHALQLIASSYNLGLLFSADPQKGAGWYWGFDREFEGLPRSGGLPERQFTLLTNVGKVGAAATRVVLTKEQTESRSNGGVDSDV